MSCSESGRSALGSNTLRACSNPLSSCLFHFDIDQAPLNKKALRGGLAGTSQGRETPYRGVKSDFNCYQASCDWAESKRSNDRDLPQSLPLLAVRLDNTISVRECPVNVHFLSGESLIGSKETVWINYQIESLAVVR